MEYDAQLFAAFKWEKESCSALSLTADRAYVSRNATCIADLLHQRSDEHAEKVLAKLRTLAPPSLRRVLITPEVSHRIVKNARGEQTDIVSFLDRVIEVEIALANIGHQASCKTSWNAWSGIGDVRIGVDSNNRYHLLQSASSLFDWPLRVDWQSPHIASLSINQGGRESVLDTSTLDPSCYLSTVEKLELAARALHSVCPVAEAMVKTAIVVIQLHTVDGPAEGYYSCSSRDYIGRLALVNAHLPVAGIPKLINALIHEAIHNLLYRIEQTHPLVVLPKHGEKMTEVYSPWSGNRLRLSTYVHACYIYHGLFWFWRNTECVAMFGPDFVKDELDYLQSGFKANFAILAGVLRSEDVIEQVYDDLLLMTQAAVEF